MTCTYVNATPTEVRAISGSTLGDPEIQPFITIATCMIEQVCGGCASAVSDTCLTQAEIQLSAHLLAISPVGTQLKEKKSESLRGKYKVDFNVASKDGTGIMSTTFGANANILTNGCLAELEKSPVNIVSIGCL